MKITKVEVFRLPTANSKQNSPIGCRIHTDVGICGDGEAGMAYGVGGSGAFGIHKIWQLVSRIISPEEYGFGFFGT